MTSQCVTELEGHLRDMLSLKPPGVTGGKISKITELCNTNIQSESVLIQRIYTHFKKTPPTHKLGVLYVVDSVTRGWVEQAKKAGQTLGQASPTPGTYAAGVGLVTELLPSFMNDMINNAPEEQKARINKLVDIWDRGSTFPSSMLSGFRQKLAAPPQEAPRSTTPTGSPPKDFISLSGATTTTNAATAPDTSKILQALADMAKSNTTAASGDLPAPTSSGNFNSLQNSFTQNVPSSVNAASSVPSMGQSVSMPGAANLAATAFGAMSSLPNFAQPGGVPSGQQQQQANNPLGPTGPSPEVLQQQVQIIQLLQAQGVPQDQWAAVLSVMMSAGAVGGANNAAPQQQQQQYSQNQNQNLNQGYGTNDPSRDRSGYHDQYNQRSPSGRYRNRSRSPSPGPGYRRDVSPPRRRDSPTYGAYGRNGRDGRGGGISSGGRDYRQRSPNRSRRSASPRRDPQALPPPGPRSIEYDRTLPPGNIKVLSRTLFVGGVTSSEDHLRGIFSQFGIVQTCIVNVDKRHAFVKMLTRQDSVRAKEGMERYKSAEMQLRTRWGVGFGPRDCSDYQTGISIIPIDRLTDADRKWMLTADYGGTGGIPMEQGMVVEEPDIEIGAGVSSKAISRRMQTDKGGQQGPRSERAENQRYRQVERGSNERSGTSGNNQNTSSNDSNNTNNSIVPNFAFPFAAFPNGFPAMPPGFVFPGAAPAQPPPPGAS